MKHGELCQGMLRDANARADLFRRERNAERRRVRQLEEEAEELRRRVRALEVKLAEAAMEINCAGPVAHRIRVLKREHAERVEQLRDELSKLRAAVARPLIPDAGGGVF